ncbi:NDP-hexose 2,3-dehydratase family protein [Streptomyces sp. CB03238]|uniref:NDP-hexose 2,3-dehydratase family protein n=1 Tax=Streptomyces sp. CB03238 TaxID=1907777 RepID=UPI000A10375A|nr:NDP-hexose 2,3-dehydratase family protein [Streptomyces sp. CB03238]ORT56523.1 NDP-hexose 2,3-dehydratase [Streptomyces sp. CB03238]
MSPSLTASRGPAEPAAGQAPLTERLARSAAARDGVRLPTAEFDAWLEARRTAHVFSSERVPLTEIDGWHFAADTGNLVHRSGRFYSVEGLRVQTSNGPYPQWHQPVINQPETGVLGILCQEFDGVLHFLMQAKMEPGNRPLLQLSPTVQATRSNYTRAHNGAAVRHIEFFLGARGDRTIADSLQSEHGWWFYRKRNRNMIVELVDEEIAYDEDFCWLTLGQIYGLLARDTVINMDSRTVLSCLPSVGAAVDGPADRFQRALAASREPSAGALTTLPELLRWHTDQLCEHWVDATRIPLRDLPGWRHTDEAIVRDDGRHFRVVGVRVEAGNREVTSWSQPLIEPHGPGLAALLVREFDGVLHALVHAKVEGGLVDALELGPTVQCRPGNYDDDEQPLFLDQVLGAGPGLIRYDAVQAEEGGRFLGADFRYVIAEAGETLTEELPPGYAWLTASQLGDLIRRGQYLSVQARTLVTCLNTLG